MCTKETTDYSPWDSQEEKDFYFEIMNEGHQAEVELHNRNKETTARIFKVLQARKESAWVSELFAYSEEAETHNPFAIVRKPKGQWQEERDFPLLGGVWVDQSTSYPCEDCYYGTVTVRIDDKRWLEMPFNS